MGDKLSLQSWVFDMFTGVYHIDWELQALKSLELKFWLTFIVFRIFLTCYFVCLAFLKRHLMPLHLHSYHFKTLTPSWYWDERNVAIINSSGNFALKLRTNLSPIILLDIQKKLTKILDGKSAYMWVPITSLRILSFDGSVKLLQSSSLIVNVILITTTRMEIG